MAQMNKAVVAFLREEKHVHQLVERVLTLEDLFVVVSPLFVPTTRITVSGVPPLESFPAGLKWFVLAVKTTVYSMLSC